MKIRGKNLKEKGNTGRPSKSYLRMEDPEGLTEQKRKKKKSEKPYGQKHVTKNLRVCPA